MISFSASAAYGFGGKQFIARITGRHPKFTFAYEFIGKKGGKRNESCEADVDEPGLYILRDVDRKGNAEDSFRLVLDQDGEDVGTDKETAMKIAKAMDAGRPFLQIVDENGVLVTPRQAETKAAAQTLDTAVEACWAALAVLPEKEAKKVLAQLRLRVSPPKVPVLTPDAPVGVVCDAHIDAGAQDSTLHLDPTPVMAFAPGSRVVCVDDQDGANFLLAGQTYEVCSLQTDSDGIQRMCLRGMARAWETNRFRME